MTTLAITSAMTAIGVSQASDNPLSAEPLKNGYQNTAKCNSGEKDCAKSCKKADGKCGD